jgi:hypothetical protein
MYAIIVAYPDGQQAGIFLDGCGSLACVQVCYGMCKDGGLKVEWEV